MSPRSKTRTKRSGKRTRSPSGRQSVAEHTGRYTPPAQKMVSRPPWHKFVGWALVGAGALLFVICEANVWNIHHHGGHIWYIVGFLIAAFGTWWLGIFDRSA